MNRNEVERRFSRRSLFRGAAKRLENLGTIVVGVGVYHIGIDINDYRKSREAYDSAISNADEIQDLNNSLDAAGEIGFATGIVVLGGLTAGAGLFL